MQKFIRPPQPDWFDSKEAVHSSKMQADILNVLLEATNNHCAFTDVGSLDKTDVFLITLTDQTFPSWEDYYPVHLFIKNFYTKPYDNKILRPDATDYNFEKYFEIDVETGLISALTLNNVDEDKAKLTIDIFDLNHPVLVSGRKRIAQTITPFISDLIVSFDVINSFSFRFILKSVYSSYIGKRQNGFIDSISIENFFCIQNLALTELGTKKEIYFLGENGDGKTLLLQALVLAFKANFSKRAEISEVAELLEISKDAVIKDAKYTQADTAETQEMSEGWLTNLFAYGITRNYIEGVDDSKKDKYGFMTLFDKKKMLGSPKEWLLKLKLEELEKDYTGIKSDEAIKTLEHLLDNNIKIEIKGSEVLFQERGAPIPFSSLSEGYRSIMIWATDLLARLTEIQPVFNTITYPDGSSGFDFKATVIVDEINLHLHPKWEYSIVRKIRKWFPNVQFIFTTHSPVTVLGASDDAVFYKLYKEDGITRVSEPYHAKDMDNWLANRLLTSTLFDLETARVAFFDEKASADTAEDNLTGLIRETVKKQVMEMKRDNKTNFISREQIQGMIDLALKNVKDNGQHH